MIGLTGCFQENISEMNYIGPWRIIQYYNHGENQTMNYVHNHKYYTIYLQSGNIFNETWIESDETYDINGMWKLDEDKRHLLLNDRYNGERKFEITYTHTIRIKNGKEEWILKKI